MEKEIQALEAHDILLPRLMIGIIDVDGLGIVAEESEIYKKEN